MDFNHLDDKDDGETQLDAIGMLVHACQESGCDCDHCNVVRSATPYLAAIRVLRDQLVPRLEPSNGQDAVRQGLLFMNALLLEAAATLEPIMQIKTKQCIDEANPQKILEMLDAAKMSMVVLCDPNEALNLQGSGKVIAVKAKKEADGSITLQNADLNAALNPESEIDLRDVGGGMNPTSIFKKFFSDGSNNLN
jgi:hypothetical protein